MSSSVLELAVALRRALAGFEPGGLSGTQCAELAEELARCEKACAGARLVAAAVAVACAAHRERGCADGASWLARQGGTSLAQGRQALATAAGLDGCAATRQALLAGEVSVAQAEAICAVAAEVDGAEAALLGVARSGDLSRLREAARATRQAALPVGALHRRQRAARHLRLWRDGLGMVCLRGALPPTAGIPLANRLEALARRARRAARPEGTAPAPFAAHLADALVAAAGGGTGGAGPRAELVIVCDLYAWRRGHAHPGEPAHLIDGGPLPVEVAKELGRDAFVKAVLHDGVAIDTVAHFGRHLPAHLRTALDLGPVPAFSGAACVDCGRRYGLEWDHLDPVANHGPTSYANLAARCYGDHQLKTERDRAAGRLGRNPPARSSAPRRAPPP